MIKFTVLVSSKSIQQFHIKGNPFYIYLFSVLRKVGLGIYIGGDLFYIYLGWLSNGTVLVAWIFHHRDLIKVNNSIWHSID